MAGIDVSEFTDDQVERFKQDLAEQLNRINAYLGRELLRAAVDEDGKLIPHNPRNVALAREVSDHLIADFEQTFGERVPEAFKRMSAAVVAFVHEDLQADGLPEGFTEASAGILTAHVDGTLTDLTELAGDASAELRSIVSAMALTPVTPDDLLEELAGKLGETAAQATTLVDTTSMALDRSVVTTQATDAGYVWFLFDGPDDQLTRPFCDARVGKLFHVSEMDEAQNDTGPQPPSVYCGGWQCRHRWVPIDVEDIRDYDRWQDGSYDVGSKDADKAAEP